MLGREIDRVRKLSDKSLGGMIEEAESLLKLTDKLVKNFTVYDRNPGRLYEARTKLAPMIERLIKIE